MTLKTLTGQLSYTCHTLYKGAILMKNYHSVKPSSHPWLVVSIDEKGLETIHAQLAKRRECDNVLCAYRRLYPNRELKLLYRPKI